MRDAMPMVTKLQIKPGLTLRNTLYSSYTDSWYIHAIDCRPGKGSARPCEIARTRTRQPRMLYVYV